MDQLINHVETDENPPATNQSPTTYQNEKFNFQLAFSPETKFSYQQWDEPNFGMRLCFDQEITDCDTGFGNGDLLEITPATKATTTNLTQLNWEITQETDSHSTYTIYSTTSEKFTYKLVFPAFRSTEHIQKVISAFSITKATN